MSYINSALRKVQKERDTLYASYGDIIAAPQKRPVRARRRLFAVYAAVVALFIISCFVHYQLQQRVKRAGKERRRGRPSRGCCTARCLLRRSPRREASGRTSKAARLYEEALTAQRGKRWEEAGDFYKQALSFDPRHVNSLNNLGVLYMSQGHLEEAIELFVKAIAAKEDYVDPYYNLACLYAQAGKVKASLAYLERAVKIDSKVREWAHSDVDFKKMRRLREFKKITEE